jgi:hypothetical protein
MKNPSKSKSPGGHRRLGSSKLVAKPSENVESIADLSEVQEECLFSVSECGDADW